jgi:hypothetical protein
VLDAPRADRVADGEPLGVAALDAPRGDDEDEPAAAVVGVDEVEVLADAVGDALGSMIRSSVRRRPAKNLALFCIRPTDSKTTSPCLAGDLEQDLGGPGVLGVGVDLADGAHRVVLAVRVHPDRGEGVGDRLELPGHEVLVERRLLGVLQLAADQAQDLVDVVEPVGHDLAEAVPGLLPGVELGAAVGHRVEPVLGEDLSRSRPELDSRRSRRVPPGQDGVAAAAVVAQLAVGDVVPFGWAVTLTGSGS